jgi:hypothetical protein
MSSTIIIPAAPAAERTRSGAPAQWIGGAVAILGTAIAIAATAVLLVFGGDSTLSSDSHMLTTSQSALVSETKTIDGSAEFADVMGRPRIRVAAEADGDRGIFVGVARAKDVDAYLAGAGITEVTDLDFSPFRMERRDRPGGSTPPRPATQDFWVARSTGERSAAIDWKVRDGSYRVVIMNADGSADVAAHGTFAVTVPHLAAVLLGIIGAGLILLVGGVAAAVAGSRVRRS